jgi:hypothetical protein
VLVGAVGECAFESVYQDGLPVSIHSSRQMQPNEAALVDPPPSRQ